MWGRSNSLIPILVPPVDFNDMRAVISGLQPIIINNAKSMDKLAEELSNSLQLPRPSISRWNAALGSFLSDFPKFYRASSRARRLGVRFLDHYMLPISHAVASLIASQGISAESSLYLILVDIDRQKHINSKHGISVGDSILEKVHQLVTEKRDGVIFSDRCGDDTFFLLFVGTKESTETLCNAFLKSIREVAAAVRKEDLWVTASIGACKYTIECRLDSWKNNTHRALVDARKEGGNAVKFGVAPKPHESTPHSWGS